MYRYTCRIYTHALGRRPHLTAVADGAGCRCWRGGRAHDSCIDRWHRIVQTACVAHGDTKVMIFQWQSVLHHGASLDTRHLITVMQEKVYWKRANGINASLQTIMAFIAWSLNVLFEGLWPDAGAPPELRWSMRGLPIAGPWRACMIGVKGDWKFLRVIMLAKRHYNASFVCFKCFASNKIPELLYTNTTASAGWRLTYETMHDYMRNTPADRRPSLLLVRGFHTGMVLPDLLHTVFLGVGRFFVASVLLALVRLDFYGDHANVDSCLGVALELHKNWRSSEGLGVCSLDRLTLSNLKSLRQYPELPGKGSDCKYMISWLALQTAVAAVGKGYHEQLLASAAFYLAQFVHILDTSPMFLGREQRECAFEAGDGFVQMYVKLARLSLDAQEVQFCVRPKLHMLQHILDSLKDRAC